MSQEANILGIFSRIGFAQILPAAIALFLLVVFIIGVSAFAFNPGMSDQPRMPDDEILTLLGIGYLLSGYLITGLLAFLISSFYYITAKQRNDYQRIAKGMKFMNWAWFALCLFSLVLFIAVLFAFLTS